MPATYETERLQPGTLPPPPPPPAPLLPPEPPGEEQFLEALPFIIGVVLTLLALGGGILIYLIQPAWITTPLSSLFGANAHGYWYLSRIAALVAFGLLWLSMALGLIITNRMARVWPGGPTASELHEYVSLLGLGFTVFHVVILLGDHYINYTPFQLLVPFASINYQPFWVGVGQIGFYLLLLVTLTFYVRSWIGAKRWRQIHMLSFASFALALFHGLFSGTDSSSLWVQRMYWASAVSVVALTAYRIAVTRKPKTRQLPTA